MFRRACTKNQLLSQKFFYTTSDKIFEGFMIVNSEFATLKEVGIWSFLLDYWMVLTFLLGNYVVFGFG